MMQDTHITINVLPLPCNDCINLTLLSTEVFI